jgi:hypothetical protein
MAALLTMRGEIPGYLEDLRPHPEGPLEAGVSKDEATALLASPDH